MCGLQHLQSMGSGAVVPCSRVEAPGCVDFSTCTVWAQELWFPDLERRLQDVWSSALAENGLRSCGSLL